MLLLAILLWFLVVTEKVFEDTFAIPIVVVGIPPGKTPDAEIPKTAIVRFHGRAKELIRLHYVSQPHFNLDLSGISERRIIKLKPEWVSIPGGMNVTVAAILKPDSIVIAMEEFSLTERPVRLDLDLKYAPGYTLFGEPIITPKMVLLAGPERAVSKIKDVLTERITLSDLSRTTEVKTRVLIPDNKSVVLNIEQIAVTLHVERLGEREIAGIPIIIKNSPSDGLVELEPAIVKATVRGAVSQLSELEANRFKAWVNCSEFDPSRPGWLPVHLESPSGTDLSATTPPRIRVKIKK